MRSGGLTVVDDVSMQVREGEIVGLIGPNGAGKTTCVNRLTGMYIPTEGTVTPNGAKLPPKQLKVVRAAMARTFQNIPPGTTILLVEQNAQAALRRATKGYVLEVGSIVLSDSGQELLESDDVRKAYLGED